MDGGDINMNGMEKKSRLKIWMIVIIALVVILLAGGTYYVIRSNQKKSESTTTSPVTTAPAATSQNASAIKGQMDNVNVGQVKSTITGLKNSLSMFNR
ncbi:MAG: hypothetical protein NUV85_02535 [Candidatus Berkelbacteria bacterium]|nr:hypothetical protein [Candidatus Berkelbacteria bacterium]